MGVLCHPDGKEYIDNLVARLKKYLYQKGEWSPETSSFTPSLANRIDRNTGGLVIGAKNLQSLKILNAKIKSREIEKFYLTVVHGKMHKSEEVLTAFLTKNEKKNLVKVTDNQIEGSKKIITKYKVLDYYDDASLLEIELLTGRTHQIRVHMAYLGHALAGDSVYGPKKVITKLSGQCLHAGEIGFIHPRTNEYLHFTSPLPEYFTNFLAELERKN